MNNKMNIENMISFNQMPFMNIPQDNSPMYNDTQLRKLQIIARSFESGFDNADVFFDAMLEISVYICLLNLKQRDTVFFEDLRQHECLCNFMPAAHDAKKFIMEKCRRYIPFFKGSAPDEIDAVLGTLICEFSGKIYSLEKMCKFPDFYEPLGFPDGPLLRHTRQSVESLFPNWDSDDRLLYASRPFSLLVCLYLKYRSAYGRDSAVRMIYGIDEILGVKKNEDFFDLVYKAISLVDGAYGSHNAKWYRPAVVLWHIFRVLRRMSEGFVCDEWMTCGNDPRCNSCEARLAPDEAENTGDVETEEADDEYDSDDEDNSDDEYMNFFNFPVQDDDETEEDVDDDNSDDDDSDDDDNDSDFFDFAVPDDEETEEDNDEDEYVSDDEDDLYFVDLNDFEEIDSSEWEKYLFGTDD